MTVAPVSRPSDFILSERPGRVWIGQRGAQPVLVEHPSLVGDTIVGTVAGQAARIALSDVTSMSAERVSVARTAALGVASGVALVGLVALIVDHPAPMPGVRYPIPSAGSLP
jgi:hypothetical protein